MKEPFKKLVWLILDGWGIDKKSKGNAITRSKTPTIDAIIENYPVTAIRAAGESVGLPWEEEGNSESGHYALGTGTTLTHPLVAINQAIWDGSFFINNSFLSVRDHVLKADGAVHIIGMISAGGVHSYVDHLYALLDFFKRERIKNVYIHAILDGKNVTNNEGLTTIKHIKERMKMMNIGKFASLTGRTYAMDRNGDWDKSKKSAQAIIEGVSKETFRSPEGALEYYYEQSVFDQDIPPTVIHGRGGYPLGKLKSGEALVFFNFRPDRMKQLVKMCNQIKNKRGKKESLKNILVTSFSKIEGYDSIQCAFPEKRNEESFTKCISKHNKRQLLVAETEKYAHMTYFFNGKSELVFPNQDSKLISSLDNPDYTTHPEMSLMKITQTVIKALAEDTHDIIIVNIANADMVGHTANPAATKSAIESIDENINVIMQAALSKNALLCITADHGNAEQLIEIKKEVLHRDHTRNPVPLMLVSNDFLGKTLGFPDAPGGDLSLIHPTASLIDVAPTLLKLLGIPIPESMKGKSLV